MHINSYKYVFVYRSIIVYLVVPMTACSLLNYITLIHTSYPYTADLDLGLSWGKGVACDPTYLLVACDPTYLVG